LNLAPVKATRIAGIIDIDNIMELLRIQKALQEHDEHRW
jgi:hypothetical protein